MLHSPSLTPEASWPRSRVQSHPVLCPEFIVRLAAVPLAAITKSFMTAVAESSFASKLCGLQLPNFNSLAVISLLAAIMSVSYSTIGWATAVADHHTPGTCSDANVDLLHNSLLLEPLTERLAVMLCFLCIHRMFILHQSAAATAPALKLCRDCL